jgi:hypothetical protein
MLSAWQFISADVIIKNDGAEIKGKIIKIDNDFIRILVEGTELKEITKEAGDDARIIIKNENSFEVEINKSEIKKYYTDDKAFEEDQNNVLTKEQIIKKEEKEIMPKYNAFRNSGIALISIGAPMTTFSLFVGTPILIYSFMMNKNKIVKYLNNMGDPYNILSMNNDFTNYISYVVLCGIFLTTGIILDIVAIYCLVSAGKEYKKLLDKQKVSINLGIQMNNINFVMKFKY